MNDTNSPSNERPRHEQKSQHGQDEESRQHVALLSQQAYQLLRENFVEEANEKFDEILEYDETNNYALVGLGDAARKKGQCPRAVEYYNRCLEHHPTNNYALFGLAECYKNMRQYHRALEAWERYLHHDNENVTVLTRVADTHRKVKNFERSKELYDRVLALDETNPYAIIGLAHLNYDFRDYENALKYWHRMLEIDGADVDIRVLTSLGNCYRKLKRFQEAIQYFDRALEREPDNFYALFGLGDAYRGIARPADALVYWNRILSRHEQNRIILTRAGDAYRAVGDPEQAQRYYRAALNLDFDPYAVLGLALLSMDEGRYEEAATSLEGLIPNTPDNPRIYQKLTDCYIKLGRRDKAIALLESFPRRKKKNRKIDDLLARLRRRQ